MAEKMKRQPVILNEHYKIELIEAPAPKQDHHGNRISQNW